ncbi:hypothetical protein ABT236_38135 [Streptomyces sp. NPDC001523]|uniref:hypothetical protein n=1 Tax=Streptomyces sp. NPDC001523 TaxID=3154383 RepID=UPI00331E5ACF
MNERTLSAGYADLLAAVADALDVPLPSFAAADEDAYRQLLEHRAGIVRSTVQANLQHSRDPWLAASQIRERSAGYPITYTPFKHRPVNGEDR